MTPIDHVWILTYVDYEDFDIIGVYTSGDDAAMAKATCQQRDPMDLRRRNSAFHISQHKLNPELLATYWWEPSKRPMYELEPD